MPSLAELIDARIFEQQEDSRRRHLGASGIGRRCYRELYYGFRWVKRIYHPPQLLRLFGRGHLEEPRFEKWLKDAGIVFRPHDPVTGKQYKIKDCNGHYGGSTDGEGENVPEEPETTHLFEFKTHNDSSFKQLAKKGVRSHKPEHYAQVISYMHGRGLSKTVYIGINKNNDKMHIERIRADDTKGMMFVEKARQIIFSDRIPEKIDENQNARECNWCDNKRICSGQEAADKNCRTCRFVEPVDNGRWFCHKYQQYIDPENKEDPEHENDRVGCLSHEFIPDLLPENQ